MYHCITTIAPFARVSTYAKRQIMVHIYQSIFLIYDYFYASSQRVVDGYIYIFLNRARVDILELCVFVDTVIGVHCTHGVNRTGYTICR